MDQNSPHRIFDDSRDTARGKKRYIHFEDGWFICRPVSYNPSKYRMRKFSYRLQDAPSIEMLINKDDCLVTRVSNKDVAPTSDRRGRGQGGADQHRGSEVSRAELRFHFPRQQSQDSQQAAQSNLVAIPSATSTATQSPFAHTKGNIKDDITMIDDDLPTPKKKQIDEIALRHRSPATPEAFKFDINEPRHSQPFCENPWHKMSNDQRRSYASQIRVKNDDVLEFLRNCNISSMSTRGDEGIGESRLLKMNNYPKMSSATVALDDLSLTKWISIIPCNAIQAVYYIATKWKTNNDPAKRIGVLNSALPSSPGGSVMDGTMGQEEGICVRSTLLTSLKPELFDGSLSAASLIYSPDVVVYSDVAETGHPKSLASMLFVDMISCPPVQHVKVVFTEENGKVRQEYQSKMMEMVTENKIRGILRVAVAKKIKYLVLGAFGCGEQGHPAHAVANIFKRSLLRTLSTEDFRSQGLEQVVFAVYDDTQEQTTWDAFEEAFTDSPEVFVDSTMASYLGV